MVVCDVARKRLRWDYSRWSYSIGKDSMYVAILQLGVLSVVDNVQNEMEKIESEQEKAKTDPVITQMFGGAGDGKPGVLEEPGNGSKEI